MRLRPDSSEDRRGAEAPADEMDNFGVRMVLVVRSKGTRRVNATSLALTARQAKAGWAPDRMTVLAWARIAPWGLPPLKRSTPTAMAPSRRRSGISSTRSTGRPVRMSRWA
ncbi:MAG: hypothetical protein AMXMBFR82_45220 [Candidatus Hydrogenedentota bacterium]